MQPSQYTNGRLGRPHTAQNTNRRAPRNPYTTSSLPNVGRRGGSQSVEHPQRRSWENVGHKEEAVEADSLSNSNGSNYLYDLQDIEPVLGESEPSSIPGRRGHVGDRRNRNGQGRTSLSQRSASILGRLRSKSNLKVSSTSDSDSRESEEETDDAPPPRSTSILGRLQSKSKLRSTASNDAEDNESDTEQQHSPHQRGTSIIRRMQSKSKSKVRVRSDVKSRQKSEGGHSPRQRKTSIIGRLLSKSK
ncbi:hypothetical protein STCU_11087 [Strigomonas culicis]|uniref:Uncharacterized protein n=1 Tax=Strigomonas culicis TaxID=28005 RepID=S9TJX9_9TRYP|nr:hypothetical protein STCU_11087 [Strigomonas culicis]|eukprot:EPY16648.1 hypothetical protein STCU_11087 [Strigomonas culicis]